MTEQTHPNYVERFSPSVEHLDRLFVRTTEQALADRDSRWRAAQWPYNMEQALLAAVTRIRELESRVAALETGGG